MIWMCGLAVRLLNKKDTGKETRLWRMREQSRSGKQQFNDNSDTINIYNRWIVAATLDSAEAFEQYGTPGRKCPINMFAGLVKFFRRAVLVFLSVFPTL